MGIPDAAPMATPATVPSRCYADLLAVDGKTGGRVYQRLGLLGVGQRRPDHPGLWPLRPGRDAGRGHPHRDHGHATWRTGLDVDALTLGSAAGGSAETLTAAGVLPLPRPTPRPRSPCVGQHRTSVTVQVARGRIARLAGARPEPEPRVEGHHLARRRLSGSSTLIDGYANGWYVPAR